MKEQEISKIDRLFISIKQKLELLKCKVRYLENKELFEHDWPYISRSEVEKRKRSIQALLPKGQDEHKKVIKMTQAMVDFSNELERNFNQPVDGEDSYED